MLRKARDPDIDLGKKNSISIESLIMDINYSYSSLGIFQEFHGLYRSENN
jgi:hypothetical protein